MSESLASSAIAHHQRRPCRVMMGQEGKGKLGGREDGDSSKLLSLSKRLEAVEVEDGHEGTTRPSYIELSRQSWGFEAEYKKMLHSMMQNHSVRKTPVEKERAISTKEAATGAGAVTAGAGEAAPGGPPRLSERTPSRPVHRKGKVSWLSPGSPVESYEGFMNLLMLLLTVANIKFLFQQLRTGLEPAYKSMVVSVNIPDEWPCLLCGMGLGVFYLIALRIEHAALAWRWSEATVTLYASFNCAMCLLLPSLVAWFQPHSTWTALVLLFLTTIVFLKLISYGACNADLRKQYQANRAHEDDNGKPLSLLTHLHSSQSSSSPPSEVAYPHNLTIGNLAYFSCAPTLCYQPSYPRTKRIRWRVVASLLFQLAVSALLEVVVVMGMQPTVASTLGYVHDKLQTTPMLTWTQRWLYRTLHVVDFYTVEKLLGLAIPCTIAWILVFYMYFHVVLNLVAELLCFADREFYKDWWNASTFFGYWRAWNLPVHSWCMRHVYFPALRSGLGRFWSSFAVFLVSAFFHELVVAVPMHAWRGYAFFAMLLQLPLCFLTDMLDRALFKPLALERAGNLIFWCIFCILGQPLIVLLITWDFYVRREGLPG